MISRLKDSSESESSPSSTPVVEEVNDDGYLSIDIRLFLAMMTVIMVSAFSLGVYLGPPASYSLPNKLETPLANLSEFGDGSNVQKNPISDQTILKKLNSKRRLPTAHSADLGRTVVEQRHVQYQVPSLEDLGETEKEVDSEMLNTESSTSSEEEHLPAGQHLLVDIRKVDSAFLNSEERLAAAMVDTVKHAKLTLLSYHCHSLVPTGVSCVGVLLESHISFHTWPDEGVITLDLFTCGSNPLIPVVPVIEKLFGIPRQPNGNNATCGESECPAPEEVESFWSHELRGFRHYEDRKAHYLDLQSDLALWVTSPLDLAYKKEIVSVTSRFQRIDIWDILDFGDSPSYEDAQRLGLEPGDPRWMQSKYATPTRLLFLDGTLQSINDNEHEYHEALVHPAMFAHPGPENVAIIGGGEGATLREVLKHRTLKDVKMIEMDEVMIEVAQKYLPQFHNCSGFTDFDNCFDDPRAELLYLDGRQWFLENYATEKPAFDVVIIDALDPEDPNAASSKLFTDVNFLESLYNSLTPEGVLVFQVGTAPNIHDPKADVGVYAKREHMFLMLENHPSTAAMLVYEEAHCGFNEPHSFLVVCKHSSCRERWYAGSDAIDFQVYERILTTRTKTPTLQHFDGSTQYSYQFPPRAWETVYCRREPQPYECQFRGLDLSKEIHDLDLENEENTSFRIEKDDDGVTHVYATKHINKGDYVMATDLASSIIITNPSKENLIANTQVAGAGSAAVIEDFLKYIDRHGHKSFTEGVQNTVVEIGGSYMMRRVTDEKEANVDRLRPVPKGQKRPPYSPVLERHRHSFDVFLVATTDIEIQEELLKYEKVWQ